jgi:(p)ppGpp synthase/HD superfamily hydrolase
LSRTLFPEEVIETAIKTASGYHTGQLDKAGRPYLGHLERVATMVQHSGGNWMQVAAAWLHDSIEDTDATASLLRTVNLIPQPVINIVTVLTHFKGEPNATYWERVRHTALARLVKLCDIYDNLDPSRMCYLPQSTQDRLRIKYSRAMLAIMGGTDG